jgi:exosome complex exonuclease RRP6
MNADEATASATAMQQDDDNEGEDSTTESPHLYETEIRNFAYLPWQLRAPAAADVVPPTPLDRCGPVTMVSTPEELLAMVAAVREELEGEEEKAIAVDLEAHNMRSFQGLVCLMQLSTRKQDFLVDTLALRTQLGRALRRSGLSVMKCASTLKISSPRSTQSSRKLG